MNNEYHRPFSLAMFQIGLLVAIAYVLVASFPDFTAASEADSSRPYASVCLSVRDETGSKEVAFTPEVEPGTGKSIIAHAVASAPCILVVVALNKRDGQLAYGWRPQFVELDEEWQEVRLPEKNKAWPWELKGEPFDFYVLIMPAGSSVAQEIRRLVTAMQVPTEEEGLLKLQTNRLRELISRAAGDSDPSKHQATTTVAEVHGITRGGNEFLWQSFASKVYFDDRNSGLLVFRSGT
ncbi:MAG: hypothetical protein JO070_08360 [Verrucomicrobia bacterium]|nr:hypothetical protein [Verrucomicrobiota bacterium]